MAIETEFKFLVDKLPLYNFNDAQKYHIDQIYFDGSKRKEELIALFPDIDISMINTFRVRKIEDNKRTYFIITLKSKAFPNGLSRYEYEKEISEEAFNSLIHHNIDSEIIKNRYVDIFNGYKFEFDEYLNLKKDLITVEVEVNNIELYEKEVARFLLMIKDHYGLEARDVTYNSIYKNSNLIKYFG